MNNEKKILYLEGRPGAHKLHRRLAQSLCCDVEFIDCAERWQDKGRSFFFNLLSWFKNAKYIHKRYPRHQILLIDNLHFTPVILKWIFTDSKRKIIVHLGSHTLYFMHAKKFSTLNNLLHRIALRKYDAIICEGKMATELVRDILKYKTPPVYTTFLGPPSERYPVLSKISPDLNAKKIIIIANGPTEFRCYYKGLDIMIKAFEKAIAVIPDLKLQILGVWDPDIILAMESEVNEKTWKSINFVGSVPNIDHYFSESSMCIHCTRGDAFPTSTLEAMAAGVPTLVSEWTGTKEVVEQVDRNFIVPLNEQLIAERILWFINLPLPEKEELSLAFRSIVQNYTQELAIDHYRNTFRNLLSDIHYN